MPDILIRNVPAEDLAQVDRNAKAQGLSREEYLRRIVAAMPRGGNRPVTLDDLRDFSERAKDLFDDDVMRRAWSRDAG